MRYKMTKKYQICYHHIRFFQAQNATESVFGRGSAPDPAGGAHDAPLDPLVGWVGGYPLPIPLPARRLRRLELGAYSASVLRPPSTQNPGYASASLDYFLDPETGPNGQERCFCCFCSWAVVIRFSKY